MVDPVILAETGMTYKRKKIVTWLAMEKTDEDTGLPFQTDPRPQGGR